MVNYSYLYGFFAHGYYYALYALYVKKYYLMVALSVRYSFRSQTTFA